MALAITTLAYTGAEAQNKTPKPQEKCSLSADGKYVTCCKTSLNPAYDIKGKTVAAKPVAKKPVAKKTVNYRPRPVRKTYYVKDYQVCKDEGGYYTCCLYENNYRTTIEDLK
ncbi:hypothetical protein GCM10023093_00940 [Nemorincola caseinilytica]|uniref:Uncharacterized protein n=2 Tax=Nemorincola caseinilytica TaxID=2054315 RepID=A0ABP8N4A5_9BACT